MAAGRGSRMREYEGNKTLLPLVPGNSTYEGTQPILVHILKSLPPGPKAIIVNHKKEDVTVRIVEPVPGDWIMIESSYEYEKTEAHTAEFSVSVPKDREVTVKYKVRMRF